MSSAAEAVRLVGEAASDPRLEALDPLRRLLGSEGFRDLVCLFLQEGGRRLEALGLGFARQDRAAVALEAHAFKGCSASFGARDLAALCARLEAQAKSGGLDGDAFDALAAEFRILSDLLAPG